MSSAILKNPLKSIVSPLIIRALSSQCRRLGTVSATDAGRPDSDESSSSFEFSAEGGQVEEQKKDDGDEVIYVKAPKSKAKTSSSWASSSDSSVTMPTSFMSGSIVGKRFYKEVKTREADDGNGWTVMLDYRTLKTPWKKILKVPTLALAKAIAAEWEYQLKDGIRPFTMPLMKLSCTALERVPLTRPAIIKELMGRFHQDLVFSRDPGDEFKPDLPRLQEEKIGPLLDWVESEFGVKPVVYTSLFGGKQEDGLEKAIESVLKNTTHCELAAVDAIAAATQSLIIAIGILRGRLQIEEAIELVRIEENLQIKKWGLVEGGHDVDVADLRVQIACPTVFLGLLRTF